LIANLNPSSQEFFERMYRDKTDPWNFATDTYERSRYDSLLSALAGNRYHRAFEPGCSIGVLTAGLAPLCDELLAIDLSQTAISQARKSCAAFSQVRFEVASIFDSAPGPLDLLVLSELCYYFQISDLRAGVARLLNCLVPGGTVLACHWLGSSPDHRLTGDEAHAVLQELTEERGFTLALSRRTENYQLASWIL